jgi:Putative peptidoglycan binding domain
MKRITLLSFAGVAFLSLGQPTWAIPHGGGGGFGGGGHFVGGGRPSGFAGGGIRAAPGFAGGGLRAAPTFQGAYFTGRSVGGVSNAPRFYYGRAAMPAVRSQEVTGLRNRPIARIAPMASTVRGQQNRTVQLTRQNTRVANSQVAATNRQPNRTGSMAGRNRVSDRRMLTPANRQSFAKNHASERHDANNWHRDWDRHRAHFHNNRVFVFIDGFWWGLYPSDYYPYYANGYPYDYYNSYPSDYYSGYPYGYYDSSGYDDQPSYGDSQQSLANAAVGAVQSELAKLGYYSGAIDGTLGDQTEAALARYQEDNGLSVTGIVDAATLQSLGIR